MHEPSLAPERYSLISIALLTMQRTLVLTGTAYTTHPILSMVEWSPRRFSSQSHAFLSFLNVSLRSFPYSVVR